MAVVIGTANDSDLRVLDGSGTSTQLSFGLSPHRPTWSPEGRHIAVGAQRGKEWQVVVLADDASAQPRVLLARPQRTYPCDWTPDGRTLIFQTSTAATGWDLHLLPLDERAQPAGAPRPFLATPFHEMNAVLSPDGRWVAYESDEVDGLFQVYARAFPAGDRKVRISSAGARWPSWSAGGKLAFWDSSARGIQVAQTRERDGHLAVESIGAPFGTDGYTSPLLARLMISGSGGRFNAHPRDGRFLVLESSAAETTPPLQAPVLVTGWSDRLRARLGGS